MNRIYYVVEANDGCPMSDKLNTLKEAQKEMKYYIKQDKEEFGIEPGQIEYYIMKYEETDTTLYYTEIR